MNFKSICYFFVWLTLLSAGLPKGIQKKVDAEIKDTFHIETFKFTGVSFPAQAIASLPSSFGSDHFFKIEKRNGLLGYAYVSKAPSKTDNFDYLVLLDPEFVIIKAKVLVYREDYGGEIGSKRWLKQFIGKSKDDDLRYNDNVVAISGATISVKSFTQAINNLLQSLKILSSKKMI